MGVEAAVFLVCAAIAVLGSFGVILAKNPVHSALMLLATFFAVAVLFIAQDAHFLAAVQVIVYAGAVVVLFLFVVMLLGVDRAESLRVDPIGGQRPLAIAMAGATAVLAILVVAVAADESIRPEPGELVGTEGTDGTTDFANLGRVIFTDYVWAFEIIALLLTIGVVGSVLLTRRRTTDESIPRVTSPSVAPSPSGESASSLERGNISEGSTNGSRE